MFFTKRSSCTDIAVVMFCYGLVSSFERYLRAAMDNKFRISHKICFLFIHDYSLRKVPLESKLGNSTSDDQPAFENRYNFIPWVATKFSASFFQESNDSSSRVNSPQHHLHLQTFFVRTFLSKILSDCPTKGTIACESGIKASRLHFGKFYFSDELK